MYYVWIWFVPGITYLYQEPKVWQHFAGHILHNIFG